LQPPLDSPQTTIDFILHLQVFSGMLLLHQLFRAAYRHQVSDNLACPRGSNVASYVSQNLARMGQMPRGSKREGIVSISGETRFFQVVTQFALRCLSCSSLLKLLDCGQLIFAVFQGMLPERQPDFFTLQTLLAYLSRQLGCIQIGSLSIKQGRETAVQGGVVPEFSSVLRGRVTPGFQTILFILPLL
jgi:hypothetical protein